MPAQNPCVLIATPTRGSPKMQYMQSVIGTIKDLARRGIPSEFKPKGGGNIVFQRSALATWFLEERIFTHLFFVDDDMAFPHDLCARAIAADKPVVGTIATTREIDFAKVTEGLSSGLSLERAMLAGHKWVVHRVDQANGSLRKAEGIGGAVFLIRRDALELMISKNAVRKLRLFGTEFYSFFVMRREDAAAEMVAEDTSFYRRWQIDCGGEVWALVDVPIKHIGDFAYGGSFSDLPSSHEPPLAVR